MHVVHVTVYHFKWVSASLKCRIGVKLTENCFSRVSIVPAFMVLVPALIQAFLYCFLSDNVAEQVSKVGF